jgi:hypothetical protein
VDVRGDEELWQVDAGNELATTMPPPRTSPSIRNTKLVLM